MFFLFIIIAFWVLMVSLSIAIYSYLMELHKVNRSTESFLFKHNTPTKATFSNIGSLLSFTTVIGIFISAILGWGSIIVVGLVAGILFGYLLFWLAIRRIENQGRLPTPLIAPATNTIMDLVNSHYFTDEEKVTTQKILGILQIVLYTTVLILELSMAKFILERLFPTSLLFQISALFLLTYLCATYTSIGGYIGVLRTDIFQIIVYGIGSFLVIWFFKRGTVDLLLNMKEINYLIPKSIAVQDILLFMAFFAFIVSYCSSWPDLWIRNIGTLPRRISSKFLKTTINPFPLIFGWFGIIIFVFPAIVFSFSLLIDKGKLTQSFEILYIIERIITCLYNIKSFNFYTISVLFLFAGAICLFITTVDTWLIGIVQHTLIKRDERVIAMMRLMVFCFVTIAMLFSLIFVKSVNSFFLVGLIASLILFGNFGVVLHSAFLPKISKHINLYIFIYLLAGGSISFIILIWLNKNLLNNSALIAIIQILCSIIILYLFPKYYKGGNDGVTKNTK